MKKIIFILLVVCLSCTKQQLKESTDCYTCEWYTDQNGYTRPDFDVCGEGGWQRLTRFVDERGNNVGGHCKPK